MNAIEKISEYAKSPKMNVDLDPEEVEILITMWLDAIKDDPEAMGRICYAALDTSHEKAVAKVIEALKQEVGANTTGRESRHDTD